MTVEDLRSAVDMNVGELPMRRDALRTVLVPIPDDSVNEYQSHQRTPGGQEARACGDNQNISESPCAQCAAIREPEQPRTMAGHQRLQDGLIQPTEFSGDVQFVEQIPRSAQP